MNGPENVIQMMPVRNADHRNTFTTISPEAAKGKIMSKAFGQEFFRSKEIL